MQAKHGNMTKNKYGSLLRALDFLISNLVIGPLVVLYWRGTLEVVGLYLLPESFKLSGWISLIFGVTIVTAANLLQFVFSRASVRSSRVRFAVFSRPYTYIVGLAIVNHWRGVWFLLDAYTGKGWISAMLSLIAGSGFLLALRSFRNVLAPPVIVVLDIFPETHYIIPTRFKQQKSKVLFTMDVLFSVVIIESLVIVTWRGLWELLDIYLFPDDTLKSGYYTFIMSYAFVLLIQIAEKPLQIISRKLEHTTMIGKVILDDVIYIVQAFVAICHKRGLWLILSVVFFPSDQELSLWLNHAIAVGGLLVMCTLNSGLPKGILIDGAQMDGEGVTMSISYAAVIVKWFRDRKTEKKPSNERPEMEQERITFNTTTGTAVLHSERHE